MSMTSETDLKTNEFLRRRKLRLQQVREQSKDIAKKIRQRAKVEKLRQIVDLDSKKEKEYFQRQDKLIKRLEQLYAQGVKSVGDSHQKASEELHNEISPEKDDLSKLRGKEAVAELRRKKQERLDQQKKILDRKLLAREAANEISREKSSNVANKLFAKSSMTKLSEADQVTNNAIEIAGLSQENPKATRNDMATQWDLDELPNEWEPNIPALSLPRDERESIKDSNVAVESKSDKSKRLDLFALSAEMPSSLRGGNPNVPEDRSSIRPSLTLVSEYLQSRALRLREPDTTASRKGTDKSTISSGVDINLAKKNSVTMYNHSTRDSRDIPSGDSRLVVRDIQIDEDAYSQALKESASDNSKDKEHQKKLQDMRNKVAMTKQTVEKEYNDTMSFLKSLPKDKCTKHMKNAYMDDRRQRILKVSRQQKLEQEFNKIEKECRKNCENARAKTSAPGKVRQKSKSPAKRISGDEFECRDTQYSWMPVPESDGNLAIHTIPLKEGKTGNTVKFSKVDSYHEYRSRHKHTPPTKDTNNDKQTKKKVVEKVIIQKEEDETTDCTSITSDTSSVDNLNIENNNENTPDKDISEADKIIIYKILDKEERERKKRKLIDHVAKVLKSLDKEKMNKAVSDSNNNKREYGHGGNGDENVENRNPIDHIDEGVYKVVSEKGDNVSSMYSSDNPKTNNERPCCCNKKNNDDLQNDIDHTGTNNRHCEQLGTRKSCGATICGRASSPKTRKELNKVSQPEIQPSAGTSISSFKTATTEKMNDAKADTGFIKLIDDDGQETGKFYIGASGLLKDDAFEVVIQLRKKEIAKVDNDHDKSKKLLESNTKAEETVCTDTQLPDLKGDNEFPSSRTKMKVFEEISDKSTMVQKEDVRPGRENTRVLHQEPSHENAKPKVSTKEHNFSDADSSISSNEPDRDPVKKLVDKGVHTSFQMSHAIPAHIPKTDPIPRPATSTYTQTTLDSPNLRPVFIHMSSSTSTAYMSPPEMVLPNFMRHGYASKTEKLRFSTRFRHQNCENESCTRKRCRCHKLSGSCRETSSPFNISCPPNTARNDDEKSDTCDNEFEWPIRKKHSKKCHKSNGRTGSRSNVQVKNYGETRNIPVKKSSSRNLNTHVNSNNASFYKNKKNNVHSNIKLNKPDLNPVIKKYVNKLLELNREGIRAIEVANQDCSSVSTPGSSIIEVPRNINSKKSSGDNKISLQQMKDILKQQILNEYAKETTINNSSQTLQSSCKYRHTLNKLAKKRSVIHKVKSLNISKRILKPKRTQGDSRCSNRNTKTNPSTSSPSSTKEVKSNKPEFSNKIKSGSKSSPTPRHNINFGSRSKNIPSDKRSSKLMGVKSNSDDNSNHKIGQTQVSSSKMSDYSLQFHKATTTSPDSEVDVLKRKQQEEAALNISTQTSQDLDSEINLMKLAENKLQNMEKIADLTEKCTKRLSNLAKVLEEVRRNKTLAYSQISTSDTASDSESRLDKNVNNVVKTSHEPAIDVQDKTDHRLSVTLSSEQEKEGKLTDSSEYVPFLTNIPKPEFKYPAPQLTAESVNIESNPLVNSNDIVANRRREKPPPALSRLQLKYGQDLIPHELSTVVEVDSPMSVKIKNQSSTNTKCEISDMSYRMNNGNNDKKEASNILTTSTNTENQVNPDLLQSNVNVSKYLNKVSSTEPSDNSKIQMMDLKQFNELMLKPFISIQEFAKQCGCDGGAFDDGSNLDDMPKDGINDELSSLHSDGSLPDVIAELLKRNIIAEPFKFDTVSNVNSTSVSSESTLSVLALSKVKKQNKKSSVVFKNTVAAENTSETSDSLSISSNPDLENAFKKLGMGWASSTLKKTKERLALSSSTNTSSSSLSQFKLKCLNEQDIPALVTDSVLSSTKISKNEIGSANTSKHVEQQTSFINSMTVKDFLTNELAKKITFTNKTNRNDTEDEFVSLFETKMPDELKHISQSGREERSIESQNNRARTSTPVQIFKSMTYHSSSSSNKSNGLFSNADDLSSVKVTSNSIRNHSTSDKDDLTIPNCSLKMRKGASDCSKSE